MTFSTLRQRSSRKAAALRTKLPDRDHVAAAFETSLGWIAIAHHDAVLQGVVFGHPSRRQASYALRRNLIRDAEALSEVDFLDVEEQPPAIVSVIERLTAFAAGEAADFRDALIDERHLTDFGRRIVRACRRIPSGATRTYGELAAACGSPGAARAVGQVMARNRYPLIVPCHRVLAAGGQLGGFSAPRGLAMKRQLLNLECSGRATG